MTPPVTPESRHSEILDLLSKTLSESKGTRAEVAELSTAFLLHEQNDHNVHRAHDERIDTLEDAADATGRHEIIRLGEEKKTLIKIIDTWKGRVWGIMAALLLAGLTGLVTHWLSMG